MEIFGEHNLEIKYRPGKLNVVPDSFSLRPHEDLNTISFVLLEEDFTAQIIAAYDQDPFYEDIATYDARFCYTRRMESGCSSQKALNHGSAYRKIRS